MYIQITTRCNMSCEHCCYSCGPWGEDMEIETFKKALDLAGDYGGSISLGGGEPTLHPLFWEFFGLAMGAPYTESVWLATNGKITNTALALARMTGHENFPFSCDLSQDIYHEAINEDVVREFKRAANRTWGSSMGRVRGAEDAYIRNVTGKVSSAGRARNLPEAGGRDHCVCGSLFIDPRGNLWPCGCQDVSLGTVWKPLDPLDVFKTDDYDMHCCCHEQELPSQLAALGGALP